MPLIFFQASETSLSGWLVQSSFSPFAMSADDTVWLLDICEFIELEIGLHRHLAGVVELGVVGADHRCSVLREGGRDGGGSGEFDGGQDRSVMHRGGSIVLLAGQSAPTWVEAIFFTWSMT